MLLSKIQIYQKLALPLPDKKVLKMLLRKSAIIWQRSWSLVLNIFRDSCFRIGHFRLMLLIKLLFIKMSKMLIPTSRNMSELHALSTVKENFSQILLSVLEREILSQE